MHVCIMFDKGLNCVCCRERMELHSLAFSLSLRLVIPIEAIITKHIVWAWPKVILVMRGMGYC